MNKLLTALGLSLVALLITAASPPATVFRPDAGTFHSIPQVVGVDESLAVVQNPVSAVAPSAATDGIAISVLKPTFDVYVEIQTNPPSAADDAGTYDPSGAADAHDMKAFAVNTLPNFTLAAYLLNPDTKKWARAPGLDVTVVGGATSFVKTGIAKPTDIATRLAYVPPVISCPTKTWIITKR